MAAMDAGRRKIMQGGNPAFVMCLESRGNVNAGHTNQRTAKAQGGKDKKELIKKWSGR
jgi:hypothetical protein